MVEIRTPSGPVSGDGHRPTPAERRRYGRSRRTAVPRRAHETVIDPGMRPDPMLQLAAAITTHDRDHAAMQRDLLLASPAAWYDGTPAFAMADLAATPRSGIRVQTYGDAALSRFAAFHAEGSWWLDAVGVPHTIPGPWEWDLKRLVTSVVLAARLAGHGPHQQEESALATVAAYREAVADLATRTPVAVWETRIGADELVAEAVAHPPARKPNGRRSTVGAMPEITRRRGGGHHLASRPPGLVRLDGEPENQGLAALFHRYLAALPDDRWTLARRFDYLDGARVLSAPGVGGNHHWLALLGDDTGRHLVLRFEEATPSALAAHLTHRSAEGDGHRIVMGWRTLSPGRDPFLGAIVDTASNRDLVVSQHRPLGRTLVTDTIRPGRLRRVAAASASVIAAGHARSGDATELAGYLGRGEALDEAIASFAADSADQAERDHAGAMAAVRGLAASVTAPAAPLKDPALVAPLVVDRVEGSDEPADTDAPTDDAEVGPGPVVAEVPEPAVADDKASVDLATAAAPAPRSPEADRTDTTDGSSAETPPDEPSQQAAWVGSTDDEAQTATGEGPPAEPLPIVGEAATGEPVTEPSDAPADEEPVAPGPAPADREPERPAAPTAGAGEPRPAAAVGSAASPGYAGSSTPVRPWADPNRVRNEVASWDDLPDDADSPMDYIASDLSEVDPPAWASGDVEQFRRADDDDELIPNRRWSMARIRRRLRR